MLRFDIFRQCTALQWCSFLNMADGAESPAARYNLHKNNPFLLLCAIRIQFMHLMHCTALKMISCGKEMLFLNYLEGMLLRFEEARISSQLENEVTLWNTSPSGLLSWWCLVA